MATGSRSSNMAYGRTRTSAGLLDEGRRPPPSSTSTTILVTTNVTSNTEIGCRWMVATYGSIGMVTATSANAQADGRLTVRSTMTRSGAATSMVHFSVEY